MNKKALTVKIFILLVMILFTSVACARSVYPPHDEFIKLFNAYEYLTMRVDYVTRHLGHQNLRLGLTIYDTHVALADVRELQAYITEYLRSEQFRVFIEEHMEDVNIESLRIYINLRSANREHGISIRTTARQSNFGRWAPRGQLGWSIEVEDE
ncbi:MAG: hypothetical protein FWE05_03830 [Defluviitaleaceae bacterium]|nr:hypothetical protein [Defluviitaleaceae bacterium]